MLYTCLNSIEDIEPLQQDKHTFSQNPTISERVLDGHLLPAAPEALPLWIFRAYIYSIMPAASERLTDNEHLQLYRPLDSRWGQAGSVSIVLGS